HAESGSILIDIVNNGLFDLSLVDITLDGDIGCAVLTTPEKTTLSYGENVTLEIAYEPSGQESLVLIKLKSNDPVIPEFRFTIAPPSVTSTAVEIMATEVWPNPSKGKVFVQTLPNSVIECYDVAGRPVPFKIVQESPDKSV